MSDPRLRLKLADGVAIVFSDAHYWPGVSSTAHRALVKLCKRLKPALVVANGDVLDGARISKHARIGWQRAPRLIDELRVCQERMEQIVTASPHATHVWPLGNHDARFETYLSNHAGEFAGVPGFSLREHFLDWKPCWALQVNDDTIIKHRWKGGKNATLNNTIQSGMNIFTGHLHAGRTSPYSDYRGTRFGVDTGTLADLYGPQFVDYTEDSPQDWRSGFVVATFAGGRLLWPEHVHVVAPGKVSFRGELLEV